MITYFYKYSVVVEPGYFSKVKTRFQSSFMLTTVQPCPGAASRAVVSLPLFFGLAS